MGRLGISWDICIIIPLVVDGGVASDVGRGNKAGKGLDGAPSGIGIDVVITSCVGNERHSAC